MKAITQSSVYHCNKKRPLTYLTAYIWFYPIVKVFRDHELLIKISYLAQKRPRLLGLMLDQHLGQKFQLSKIEINNCISTIRSNGTRQIATEKKEFEAFIVNMYDLLTKWSVAIEFNETPHLIFFFFFFFQVEKIS